jgi:hypothetical protein
MSDCHKLRALAESYYKKHKTLMNFPLKAHYTYLELDECLLKVQFTTAEKKWRGKRGKTGLRDDLLKELERAPPPSSANTATPPHAAGSPSPTSLQPGPVSGLLSLGGAAVPPEGVLDHLPRLQAELTKSQQARAAAELRAKTLAAELAAEKRARAAADARAESQATAVARAVDAARQEEQAAAAQAVARAVDAARQEEQAAAAQAVERAVNATRQEEQAAAAQAVARAVDAARQEELPEAWVEDDVLHWRDELAESQRARAAAERRAVTLAAELAAEKRARAAESLAMVFLAA